MTTLFMLQYANTITGLFLQFIQYELGQNNFKKIQSIHWKAVKVLEDKDEFEKTYEKLTK